MSKTDYSVEHLNKVRVQIYTIDTSICSACIEFRSDLEYEPLFWVHFNHSIIGRFFSYMDAVEALHSHYLAFKDKLQNEV